MDQSRRALTIVCTALAVVCFGANSVLCRLALRPAPISDFLPPWRPIDPATFTAIRFTSGAIALVIIGALTGRRNPAPTASWSSAAILVLYAIPFSFAYVALSAGTGALLLFGFVQVTMLIAAWRLGERLHAVQWLGLTGAAAGLVYLALPTLTTPAWDSALAMAVAGFAWGLYSLRGRGSPDPLATTTANFIRSVPILLLISAATSWRGVIYFRDTLLASDLRGALLATDLHGAMLATASGVIASGLGYVLWYTALRGLTAFRASIVQFAAPVLAAVGGVIFLGETISVRLLVSGLLVIGGLAIALPNRSINN